MTIREERAAKAAAMRARGMTGSQIAEAMGVRPKTVYSWLDDPDGSKLAARKDSYRGTCEECGGPTDGSYGPGKAPRVCLTCITWTEEAVIEAMRRWADANGGLPPRMVDWRPSGPGHPVATARVIKRIGWNELLLRAGFELRCDRRPETQTEMERLLREGWSVREVAERFGCVPENVYFRLHTRGLRVSDLRRAA